jgi:serine/threonine protein kinase
VLIDTQGRVKLGDFGLARVLAQPERGFSYQAATRWYRAPEMLYAARMYGPEVDIWSAGCIMAELLALSPLFPGETDIDQLNRIYSVCGTPDVWLHLWPVATEFRPEAPCMFHPIICAACHAQAPHTFPAYKCISMNKSLFKTFNCIRRFATCRISTKSHSRPCQKAV